MDQAGSHGKKWYLRWYMWVVCIGLLFIVISSFNTAQQKARDVAQSGTSTPTPSAAVAESQTLLKISGSGSKTTEKFTVAGDWDLNWTYDCKNFGQSGNFQVFIFTDDGQMSFNNSPVNQLGMSDSGVEHYHKGGTYYLTMNSVCKWSIEVKG